MPAPPMTRNRAVFTFGQTQAGREYYTARRFLETIQLTDDGAAVAQARLDLDGAKTAICKEN